MVSCKDSPFAIEEALTSSKVITLPPICDIAVSKESLVLVDGSKNNVAITWSFRWSLVLFLSKYRALSRTNRISSFEKSRIEITSFPFKFIKKKINGQCFLNVAIIVLEAKNPGYILAYHLPIIEMNASNMRHRL